MNENSKNTQSNQRSATGRLIVLTGPAAVGKGTVEACLRRRHPQVWVSVSATTRNPRPGEVNGRNYWFMSEEEFARRDAAGEFLESALVHNMSHYATPLKPVLDHLAQGIPVILEIDLQGAHRVRQQSKSMGFDVYSVFLAPPSYEELVRRLVGRGTENAQQREKRLETAKVELASESQFDRTIINSDVSTAADELWGVIVEEYGLDDLTRPRLGR